MNYSIILLIIGMALVTYIPRALPAIVIERLKFNTRVEKFLRLIPYTAMAALWKCQEMCSRETPKI